MADYKCFSKNPPRLLLTQKGKYHDFMACQYTLHRIPRDIYARSCDYIFT